jgi:hypothetical protein
MEQGAKSEGMGHSRQLNVENGMWRLKKFGWLIHSFLLTIAAMKSSNFFNRKGLKSFGSSLRNKSTSAEAALWNILKSRNLGGAPLPTGRQALVNIMKFRKMKTGTNILKVLDSPI